VRCAAEVVFLDGPARGDGDKQALVGRGEHATRRETASRTSAALMDADMDILATGRSARRST
jgi:hypothetical protein